MAFGNTESGLTTDEGFRAEDFEKTENFNKVYESSPAAEEVKPAQNKWALRDRFRSKAAWVAMLGVIIQIFSAFGIWAKIGITAEGFREIAFGIGTILDIFGVWNDPTNREGF